MDDYAIVRDEYFYIKERAFKALHEIQKSDVAKIVTDDEEKQGAKQPHERTDFKSETQSRHKAKIPESRHLRCPLHSCELTTVYLDTVLIDYCPECYGIWLDFGEIENLLKKKLETNQLFKTKLAESVIHEEDQPVNKKCPVCLKPLQKKKHYSSNVHIDICRICGGVWLDSGEFAALYLDNKGDIPPRDILAGVMGNYIDIEI
ncbi:MAG: zf-TFIIB domain-containing protein [Spirochaetales bacterium]|nr:zf-TFIIB domain-containing protein [Spirochaetales bacterium]